MKRLISKVHYYDYSTHFWCTELLINRKRFYVGHYMYEDDAIAAGINAKLNFTRLN